VDDRACAIGSDPIPMFPPWARYVEAAIPVSLAVAVSIQHDALLPPDWAALAAFLAAAPWVLGLFARGRRAVLRPIACVVVLAAVAALIVDPVQGDIAPFFLVYLVGHEALVAPRWEVLSSFGASMLLMVGVELSGRYEGAFVWLLGLLVAWAAGLGVRSQIELNAAQLALAEQAVVAERQRIAREIHDVVAHTLSVTMLYVTGARLALRRDPVEAEEALLAAEKLGRESLAEIRRTVGLLAPGASGTEAPMPTAAEVPELVDEFRTAGLDVELTLVGDAATLPPATGLALYRIAQESLTNVVKHAPGTCAAVRMEIGPDATSLRVHNSLGGAPRNGTGDGLGVRGMQQRAELLGGSLHAGARDGEWVVEAEVPAAVAHP
jgi:signal transduction histidine kinase